MSLLSDTSALIKKEFLFEWRHRYSLNGILLYAASTVFVIYISLKRIDPQTWNTLFWIIMLFTAVNAIAKSFVIEGRARWLYYYTITSARGMVLAKMIYNMVLMLAMGVITYGMYSLITEDPVKHTGLFIATVMLGTASFGLCLSMIAAIAAKAGNNTALMAILSFPVILPILLVIIRITSATLLSKPPDVAADLAVLLAIDGLVVVLSVVLFPYLWRD